jgi:hypothetical protein|tara:strand:+ start:811 stop:1095 length:285 start_codon:yes stop_codon:yes gene_type:complete
MSDKSREYQIKKYTNKVQEMLISKNKAYGSSALEPLNIFSKGRPSDSLCARIDDKLARIKNVGISDKTEDTVFDLVGYLILLMISIDENEKRDI